MHASPAGFCAVQIGIGIAVVSQNRSSWHWLVLVHGAPSASCCWHVPPVPQKKPSAHVPFGHGKPPIGNVTHFWSGPHSALFGAPAQS